MSVLGEEGSTYGQEAFSSRPGAWGGSSGAASWQAVRAWASRQRKEARIEKGHLHTAAAKKSSLAEARAHAFKHRCTWHSATGATKMYPLSMSLDPIKQSKVDSLYGVPVAMSTYMRFLLLVAATLCIMFLIELPSMLEARDRNELRNDCRQALADDAELITMSSVPPTNAELWSDCAYNAPASHWKTGASDPVRTDQAIPKVPDYLLVALGACMEYSDVSRAAQPTPAWTGDLNELFTEVPDSKICTSSGASNYNLWSGVLNVAVFCLLLLYLKQLAWKMTHHAHLTVRTAGDYALMFEGLEVGSPADTRDGIEGLEERLYGDLEDKLGILPSEISHIELGRKCHREERLARKLTQLQTLEQEIDSRRRKPYSDSKAGEKEKQADYDAHGDVWVCLSAVQSELEAQRAVGHRSTGQAFVCFQQEERRNECLQRFQRPTFRDLVTCRAKEVEARIPKLSCAAKHVDGTGAAKVMHVKVSEAPNPGDVYWEHLEFNEGFRLRRASITWTVSLSLILGGMVANTSALAWKAGYVNSMIEGETDLDEGETSTRDQARAVFASVVSTAIVSTVNILLVQLVPRLTRQELLHTRIDYNRSIFIKLAIGYVRRHGHVPSLRVRPVSSMSARLLVACLNHVS